MRTARALADVAIEKRYHAAVKEVREWPRDGDLLLSLVVWPDPGSAPSEPVLLDALERMKRRRSRSRAFF
jgi:hypothetical protein